MKVVIVTMKMSPPKIKRSSSISAGVNNSSRTKIWIVRRNMRRLVYISAQLTIYSLNWMMMTTVRMKVSKIIRLAGIFSPNYSYHPCHIGEVLINRYVLIQKLGWGHFSTVWLAKDFKYSSYVAIKIMKSAPHYLEASYDEV